MKSYPQWIVHRDKVPLSHTLQPSNPHDPANWMDHQTAAVLAEACGLETGFVLTPDDPFVCIDIDDAIIDGQWSPLAVDLCQRTSGCYVEVSRSGKGLHIFGTCHNFPPHACKNVSLGIELYTERRFIAVTGTDATGDPNHPMDLQPLIDQYFKPTASTDVPAEWTDGPCPEWSGPTDDMELIAAMLRAQSTGAIFGAKASANDLWKANEDVLSRIFPSSTGQPFDHSSADQALCNHFAWWTGKDCERMDRLFRRSALVRDKWTDREDYRRATILNACRSNQSVHGQAATPGIDVPPPPRPRFHFIPANEVIANQQPPKWLIRGFLECETMATIFGPPECFKSFIGLDMGLCIVAGIPWHGQAVTPGPVLYLCGEGRAGIGRRIEAWCKSHQTTATQFFISSGAAALLETGSVNEVLAATAVCGNPALVIVDTLNRNFGPGDENSTQDMTGFIRAIDTIRAALNCAVLIVHHSGVMASDRARGSSALRGALDFEYQVSRVDGDTIAATSVEFKAAKTKDHDRPPTITFRPVVVDLGRVDEDLNPVTSLILERGEAPAKRTAKFTGAVRIALEALRAVVGEDGRAHIDAWRQEAYGRGISNSDKPNAKQKAFTRAVSKLSDDDHIQTMDDFYWEAAYRRTLSGDVRVCPVELMDPGHPGQDRTKPDNVRDCLAV